ncbi:hypothetical protein KAH81_04635 [bacterium]|nr:hypothetical protein [bacterium]
MENFHVFGKTVLDKPHYLPFISFMMLDYNNEAYAARTKPKPNRRSRRASTAAPSNAPNA